MPLAPRHRPSLLGFARGPGLARRLGLALLLGLAPLLGLSGTRSLAGKEPAPGEGQPRRLVLLVLGGGVRAADVLDRTRLPTAVALAERGARAEGLATRRPTTWLALRDLLTGREDEPEAPGRPRSSHPTLFEAVRSLPGVRAQEVWFVDAGGTGEPGLEASTHPDYGPSLGASVAAAEGAFAGPLAGFLEQMGRPLPVPEHVWPLLRRLRDSNRRAAGPFLPEPIAQGLADSERVERAVLEELDRKAAFVKAAQPADERALRAALTLLAVHRPRLLVLRLAGAESALQGLDPYFAALRQADEGLRRLEAAIAGDPRLAASTALAVATESGRNAAAGADGSLGATEDSPSRRNALLLLAGPGVKAGARPKGTARLADVAPTLARLLGASLPSSTGRPWEECLR